MPENKVKKQQTQQYQLPILPASMSTQLRSNQPQAGTHRQRICGISTPCLQLIQQILCLILTSSLRDRKKQQCSHLHTANQSTAIGKTYSPFTRLLHRAAEIIAIKKKLFERYDFDCSGTINTTDELKQLVTNVTFTLQQSHKGAYKSTACMATLECVDAMNDQSFGDDGWSFEVFDKWFDEKML